MHYFEEPKLGGAFLVSDHFQNEVFERKDLPENLIHLLWNRTQKSISFIIDNAPICLHPNQILSLTYLQKFAFGSDVEAEGLVSYSFNKAFYCIMTHDEEVSCNGVIFFGAHQVPVIDLEDDKQSFELLHQVVLEEFLNRDKIQGDMLRMLLKRFIIKCTRLAIAQGDFNKLEEQPLETVRAFNVLVDLHFRTKRSVKEYAEMLNKSPKTLSNYFKKHNSKSPLQLIHERVILEARRLLSYTDKSSKEIAFDIGFEEVAAFNKMFKRIVGASPTEFKKGVKK